jgi:acyl carrier protein
MDVAAMLKDEIKKLMVENLMLQVPAEEIGDEQALFGAESLGLDSVDALQLVVALDKQYGLKIPDPAAAQQILRNVKTIVAAIDELRAGVVVVEPGTAPRLERSGSAPATT